MSASTHDHDHHHGFRDAIGLAAAIRGGKTSAVEAVREALARIGELDEQVRAYVYVDRDGAMAAARDADARLQQAGPEGVPAFHGVPLSIKDNTDVAGMPTTHSCRALAHHVAATDDPLIGRFRRAGFIIIGKTNIPEFCTSMTASQLNGVSRNPWNLDLTPGGSSGGAAAALAAGMCTVAHGTDGAGSTRVPASFCGLVGLKPSRQLICYGPHERNQYFGTSEPGILTRSVRDAAAILDVMAGTSLPGPAWSPRPSQPYATALTRAPGRLRIAVCTDPPFGRVEEACAAAATTAGSILESLGHDVGPATPDWGAILVAAAGPMSVPGAAALVGPDQYDLVEPRNRPMVERLAAMTVLEHSRWADLVRSATASFTTLWDDYDLLVTPTCGLTAPDVSWAPWDKSAQEHNAKFASMPNFAQPFNLSGQPAISLPLSWSPDGMPIGVQLAGRYLEEDLLLSVAAQLETALPWSHRTPPLLTPNAPRSTQEEAPR
jgi:amidase